MAAWHPLSTIRCRMKCDAWRAGTAGIRSLIIVYSDSHFVVVLDAIERNEAVVIAQIVNAIRRHDI